MKAGTNTKASIEIFEIYFAASTWLHFLCPLTLLYWDINSRVNNNNMSSAYDQPLANVVLE